MQAKLDEETRQLLQLQQNLEQEWAGRALAGGACHRARDVQRHIIDDARAGLPLTFNGAGQNLAAATMLLRTMLEPSTTEGRRVQGELKGLLENAVVQEAESSFSRRRGCPLEHHATSSRHMREASIHTEHTGDRSPVALDRLGNEQHRRDRRARLEERVRRGYHPRRGGRYAVRRIGAPHPNHQARGSSAEPYDGHRSWPVSELRLPSPNTQGRRGCCYGSQIIDWRASWEGRTTTTSSSATSPSYSPTLPEPG
jgi:hypothetical protein